jgi:hypothetical protein
MELMEDRNMLIQNLENAEKIFEKLKEIREDLILVHCIFSNIQEKIENAKTHKILGYDIIGGKGSFFPRSSMGY